MDSPSSAQPLFLGIDVGTQSLRAGIYDELGQVVGAACTPCKPRTLIPAGPNKKWNPGGRPPSKPCRARSPRRGRRRNTSPPSGWTARLAQWLLAWKMAHRFDLLSCGWISDRFVKLPTLTPPAIRFLRYVSGQVSPEWMLPKALWLKRNEPQNYLRARYIVECTDWMMHQLTGNWTLSLNHVTVKWNYARPDGGWSSALLDKVGLEDLKAKWPATIVPLGKGSESLSEQACAILACVRALL